MSHLRECTTLGASLSKQTVLNVDGKRNSVDAGVFGRRDLFAVLVIERNSSRTLNGISLGMNSHEIVVFVRHRSRE